MLLKDRIRAFYTLGELVGDFVLKNEKENSLHGNASKILNKALVSAEIANPWFTKENILFALKNISQQLTEQNLNKWLEKYNLPDKNNNPQKTGVVLAGNIPLVGFHDFLCVLITGNIFIGKMSSKDNILLKALTEILESINPEIKNYIFFEDKFLKNFNAVIATGSNNSSVYFKHYFGKVPNIIRKNRNSVAIITGKETPNELKKTGKDIFTYFGLGCRNISKIYFPENYNIPQFLDALEDFKYVINHNKYANNYTYNQTLYLMKGIKYFDNGFALFVENNDISSPISVIYYEFYKNIHKLYEILKSKSLQIQCVVTTTKGFENRVNPGETQKTELWDFADNIDTIEFLNSLN